MIPTPSSPFGDFGKRCRSDLLRVHFGRRCPPLPQGKAPMRGASPQRHMDRPCPPAWAWTLCTSLSVLEGGGGAPRGKAKPRGHPSSHLSAQGATARCSGQWRAADASPAHRPVEACSRSVCPKGSVLPVTVSLSRSTQGWTLWPGTPRTPRTLPASCRAWGPCRCLPSVWGAAVTSLKPRLHVPGERSSLH